MKKRLLAIFLSVCTLIGAVPSLILAAQDIIIFDPVEPSTSGNDILKLIEQAALKETSLFYLAELCGIQPAESFVQRFIDFDREVRADGQAQ